MSFRIDGEIAVPGDKSLTHRALMLAAAAGAAILGEWEEGAFLLFLFSLGHAGEHYALDRARNAVNALGELMPRTARVRRERVVLSQRRCRRRAPPRSPDRGDGV